MSSTTEVSVNQEIHNPSELYDAMQTRLEGVFEASGAAVTVAGYEDWMADDAPDRQVLIEMSAADGGEWLQDGRHGQVYECVLYAVISKGCKRPAMQAMDLAAQLMRLVHKERWGFSGRAVDYPARLKSEMSFLVESSNKHQGFEAWEVRWDQLLKFGSPQLGVGDDAFDPVVTEVNFTFEPDAAEAGFKSVEVEQDA